MANWSAQFVALDTSFALAGVALFYWSRLLSQKYNAWTTRLRTKFPNINPPPTPQMAQLNHKVMLNLIRICGVILFAGAVWAALAVSH
jgi:hypothetical protein